MGMTMRKIVSEGMRRCKEYGKEDGAIKILALELSGLNGADFYLKYNEEVDEENNRKIRIAIDDYLIRNIPVQYILGYSYFFGRKFIVNDSVLIPRPETEELVGLVLQTYDRVFGSSKVILADVGTGSGAIAVTLALEEPNFFVFASDISEEALRTAKMNCDNLEASVDFLQGDMLEPFINQKIKIDILVSNPPYIPEKEWVESIVKDNEPHVALFGGDDGLKFYRQILEDSKKIMNTPGVIAFEHGYDKKEKILDLAKNAYPDGVVECIKDIFGKDRLTIIIIE